MLVCKAYPAKVTLKVEITLGEQILFTHTDTNQIQFPDGSEWSFSIGILEFQTLMNRPQAEQALLHRNVEVDYSDLDEQKRYKSKLTQIFVPADNQWKTIISDAT